MNHYRSFRPMILLASLGLALAGCGQGNPGTPPLEGARLGGPFTLINQDGQRVSDANFAGQYRLVYFGFANCPDVCPVDLQVIGAGLRQFEQQDAARGARVTPIFITVDPARDTPEVLKRYVPNFHPRMVGLTGNEQELEAVRRAFGAHGSRGETTPGGGYNVNHSRTVLLMGPQGEPIAIVPQDEGPEAVAAELARWVR